MWLKRSESFRPGDHDISRRVTPTAKTDVLRYRNGLRVMNALLITAHEGWARVRAEPHVCASYACASLQDPKRQKVGRKRLQLHVW